MALQNRLADNTVTALVELVRDLNERLNVPGASLIYGDALYGDGDEQTVRQEVAQLVEATAHV